MQLYSDKTDFENSFQRIIDIIKGAVKVATKEELTMAQSVEWGKHMLLTYFSPNSSAPGAIIGIGKEPDTPNDTSKEELRKYGLAYKKNGLISEHLYIIGEERFLDSFSLFITGAKVSKILNTQPHIESYRFELTRHKKGLIDTIGEQIKCPLLPYHKMYIDGFLDMDKVQVTALDRLLHFRGSR